MKNRILSVAICAIAALMVVGIGTTPAVADSNPYEIDDWGTQFSTNPVFCTFPSFCWPSQTETNISPGTFLAGPVNRTETLLAGPLGIGTARANVTYNTHNYPALAQTFAKGERLPNGQLACGTGGNEGCLGFATGDNTFVSMTLDYLFTPSLIGKDAMSILVINSGNTFALALYYLDKDGITWDFASSHLVDQGPPEYYKLPLPASEMTGGLRLVYNPSDLSGYNQVDSIEVQLCCVMATPEPSTVLLLGSGALGVAGSDALGFTNFGLLGLAGALRRKLKR
jgi:hypothetical protein